MKFLKLNGIWINLALVSSIYERKSGSFCLSYTHDPESFDEITITDPRDIRELVAFLQGQAPDGPTPREHIDTTV